MVVRRVRLPLLGPVAAALRQTGMPPLTDPRTRLVALLMRTAPTLAEKLWTVRDVRELPADVRGEICDVIGYEAAQRGLDRNGTPNQLGRELDVLADALLDDTP